MEPRGLSIVMPQNLSIVMPRNLAPHTVHVHLLKFLGLLHEDPSNYIEQCIETFVTNAIPEESYRLVWLSTTLQEQAYEWYCLHVPKTFTT